MGKRVLSLMMKAERSRGRTILGMAPRGQFHEGPSESKGTGNCDGDTSAFGSHLAKSCMELQARRLNI